MDPTTDTTISLVQDILALIEANAWLPASALLIGLVIRLVKGPFAALIPPEVRPWIAVGLGGVSALFESLVADKKPVVAFFHGVFAAVLAIAGHELFVHSLRGGREFFAATTKKKK